MYFRAFRIGQCRDVKVFRFITEGTIEEIMYLRQVYKQVSTCIIVCLTKAVFYL